MTLDNLLQWYFPAGLVALCCLVKLFDPGTWRDCYVLLVVGVLYALACVDMMPPLPRALFSPKYIAAKSPTAKR